MAAHVTEFKCPACGGSLEFDSSSQKVVCPYCSTEFETSDLKAYEEDLSKPIEDELSWESSAGSEWGEEGESLVQYHCSSCGGDIYCNENTSATTCPYCASPVLLNGRLSGILKPDYIIPFQKKPEDVEEALKKHMKGKVLLAPSFRKNVKVEEIKGVYVPFWLFDADSAGRVRWKGTKVRHWSDSNYNYTETKYYSIIRAGKLHFDHVPVDGSKSMDDQYMESIEPYYFKDAKDFSGLYLAGYYADRYDVDQEAAKPRAVTRMKDGTVMAFATTIDYYSTLSVESCSISLSNSAVHYALYPVYTLATKWKEKSFLFALNAQTGKLVGNLPISWGLFFLWLICTFILSGAALFGLTYAFEEEKTMLTPILVGIIGGLVIGLVVAFLLKKQLKSVAPAKGAMPYIKDGSLDITESRDIYLYRRVTKTRRANNNNK